MNSKVVYLVLAILTGDDGYELKKIKFNTIFTCDEIFLQTVNFKKINGRTYPIYKDKISFAHYCLNEKGDYYLGYG